MGFLLLVLSLLLNNHFYFLYLYFFAASIVAFLLSKQPYAELGKENLCLFYGHFPFREKLYLPWTSLNTASIETTERKAFAGTGADSVGGIVVKYDHVVLRINLKERLRKETRKYPKIRWFFAHRANGIEQVNDGSSIVLHDPPVEGFANLENDINTIIGNR